MSGRRHLAAVYRNLYPWKTLDEFVTHLKSTIAYRSPDNRLIALSKPFGVGIHTVQDNNTTKQNQDKLLYQLGGSPRYCISDALDSLRQEFNSETPLEILKGPDRYTSGLTLITNDAKTVQPELMKALARSRTCKQPPFGFRAITSGYPTINSKSISEHVGVRMVEVDELGDYKEPEIVPSPSKRFKLSKDPSKNTFHVEFEVKHINREYSSSMVEVYVSKEKWDFVRCYISSKTSFILGDVRFSKRIREILGKPIQVSAFKSSHWYDDNYEPLNGKLRNLLGVPKNSSIPLMLDLFALRLKGFDRERKGDLFIKSMYMPVHFAETAARLKLIDDLSESCIYKDKVPR